MTREIEDSLGPFIDPERQTPLFPIPEHRHEISLRAQEGSKLLIENPLLLTALLEDIEKELFLAETEGDEETERRLISFLKAIDRNLYSYDWKEQRNSVLEPRQAYTVLENLPPLDPQKRKSRSVQLQLFQEITSKIAAGYLNRRFDYEPQPDWRQALYTLSTFLDASVLRSDNLDSLSKFLDLYLGNYEEINPSNSLAYRSTILGTRDADPNDEKVLEKAFEITNATSIIANILDRKTEYIIDSAKERALWVKFDVARDVYRLDLDPTKGSGRRLYKQIIIDMVSSPEASDFYGDLKFRKIANQNIPPDVVEVALLGAQNFERTKKLADALNHFHDAYNKPQSYFTSYDFLIDRKGYLQFPYNITSQPSPIVEKLMAMEEPATLRSELSSMAFFISEQHDPNWHAFSFAQQGVRGFVVSNPEITPDEVFSSKKVLVEWISKQIEEKNIAAEWERARTQMQLQSIPSIDIEYDNITFILAKKGFIEQTSLETILDLGIPEKYRLEALTILREVINLRNEIPRNFTQMPTRAGDLYPLSDHPDIPGVLEAVTIRKQKEGGIIFSMNLLSVSEVVPDEPHPRITGIVSFPQNRVRVTFDERSSLLPNDLQWLSEGILLKLIERSCCVPISEDELYINPLEFVPETGLERKDTPVPGHIVHVGGFRKSGERKQYTEEANINYRKAMDELGMDTSGLSLAAINREHRIYIPECKRFLTWNRGYEPLETPPPVIREAPERLVPFY